MSLTLCYVRPLLVAYSWTRLTYLVFRNKRFYMACSLSALSMKSIQEKNLWPQDNSLTEIFCGKPFDESTQ